LSIIFLQKIKLLACMNFAVKIKKYLFRFERTYNVDNLMKVTSSEARVIRLYTLLNSMFNIKAPQPPLSSLDPPLLEMQVYPYCVP
jgi:hypothetical protein